MLEGKLIVIPTLGRWNKDTSTSQAWLTFVLMSQLPQGKMGAWNPEVEMHACFSPLKSTDTMTDVWADALANAAWDSLLLPLLECFSIV